MVTIEQLSHADIDAQLADAEKDYAALQQRGLTLDLTRGKPSAEQTALSDALDGILQGDYLADDGTDVRNYGGLRGLSGARTLFASVLETPADNILVGGNSSLSLMYEVMELALCNGLRGPHTAWGNSDSVKFLCPSPGYDRHFAICEHFGIEMIPVRMLDSGPDMDQVETLLRDDSSIKGMWCVPRFSNPTGCVYSEVTVERIAKLSQIAGEYFLVMWDNAYAVHALRPEAAPLASIYAACEKYGTLDSVFQFGSTSKITFAGAGVAYLASSEENLAALEQQLSLRTIGPDKVNQLRHLRLFPDRDALVAHMEKHADILNPRFDRVLETLDKALAGTGMGSWTSPEGGYFVSFDTRPGLAREVVSLAEQIGVKLTPAGATFPYGDDPSDSNIRLAPSFASLEEVGETIDAFVVCVKLASLRQVKNSG